jgi:hypothetical protein
VRNREAKVYRAVRSSDALGMAFRNGTLPFKPQVEGCLRCSERSPLQLSAGKTLGAHERASSESWRGE